MSTHQGIVIVTGASRGVGKATAEALVGAHGRTTIAVARNAAALAELKARVDSPLLEVLALDLEAADAPDRLARAVAGRRVAALVNNAGLLLKRELGEWSEEDLVRLYRVNVVAPLRMVQALLPVLAGDPPGHVVNVGSMGGVQGSMKFPGLLGYSTSKGALVVATECLAEELKDRGVRANCVCLGAVDTEMLRDAFPGYKAPVGPAEVGAFLARFAVEGANLFNGKVLQMATSTP